MGDAKLPITNGNVTALTRYGQSATSPEDALSYTYSGDRIASISNSGSLGGGGSYTYDADGNVTHDGLSGLDMEYNAIGLTKKIARNGSTLAEYSYLADGARLSAVGSDGTGVRYLGSLIYSRASDGTLSLDCALTPGGRIVRTAGSGTSGSYQVQHFLRDHLGSVRAVVDGATGGVLETSDYLPLGRRWDLTGGQSSQTVTDPTNRWRFSGKESQAFFDQGIPYSDFGARLHDPRTGRWLAPDPLAEKYYGYSLYSFCKNTPVSRIDLDGQDDYRFDNKSGQFIMMEQNNNSKDRVLGYHLDKKTGEYTKNHRWYQRKTLIDNIEKGILSDGINFQDNNQLIEVGGESHPSERGVNAFLVRLSDMVGKEIAGAYFSVNEDKTTTHITIGSYKDNEQKKVVGSHGQLLWNQKYDNTEFLMSDCMTVFFHTHPSNHDISVSDRTRPSTIDLDSRNKELKDFPNLKFLIFTHPEHPGNDFPLKIDYTNY